MREDDAKDALREGISAFRAGVTVNPHPLGTIEAQSWEQGRRIEERFAAREQRAA